MRKCPNHYNWHPGGLPRDGKMPKRSTSLPRVVLCAPRHSTTPTHNAHRALAIGKNSATNVRSLTSTLGWAGKTSRGINIGDWKKLAEAGDFDSNYLHPRLDEPALD